MATDKPRSLPKTLLVIASLLLLIVALFIAAGAGYFLGQYRGMREGLRLAADLRPLPPGPAGGLYEAPKKGVPLPPVRAVDRKRGYTGEPQAALGIGEDGSLPSLSDLEATIGKILPGRSQEPIRPPPDLVAQVKRKGTNTQAAIDQYISEVHGVLETSLSGQEILAGLQGGQGVALAEAMANLTQSETKLKSMTVPSKAVPLHATYLMLMEEVRRLYQQPQQEQEDEMGVLLGRLGHAQRALAIQKQITAMEQELTQKGSKP